MKKSKTLSIIVPVRNEQESLKQLFKEIINLREHLNNEDIKSEFLFLDNNSSDKSLEMIINFSEKYSEILYFSYSKNIGYEKSIMNGLKLSSGDAIVILDSDLQDPPELILEFVQHWKKGESIVAGLRVDSDETIILKSLRKLFYKIIQSFSFQRIPANIGAFILFDKKIRDMIIKNISENLYIRGDILTSGYNIKTIDYKRKIRKYGKSNFNYKSLLKFSTDKMFLTSDLPTILPISMTVISFILSLTIAVYLIVNKINNPDTPQGFTFIALLLTLSLLITSIISSINIKYLSLIYSELTKFNNYQIVKTNKPELIKKRLEV